MSPNECGVDIRADVLELPNYVPGARALSAEVAKLSSNENPYPPPSTVVDAAQAALTSINRYPDMACHDLKEALATYHEVSSESIVLGTGSSALLIHAMTSVGRPGSKVIYPWRSFESYPIATVTSGSQALPVPLAERGRHDFDAMA